MKKQNVCKPISIIRFATKEELSIYDEFKKNIIIDNEDLEIADIDLSAEA